MKKKNQPSVTLSIAEKVKNFSIPTKLNLVLTLGLFICNLSILIIASHLSLRNALPLGIIYSFLLLCSYALLHEATHGNLHPHQKWNHILGVINAILFPTSFSMVKITHIKHHCCNRTDHEMFDLYYDNHFKYFQFLRWYFVLMGGFWFMIPIGPIILSVYPNITKLEIVQKIKSSQIMFEDMNQKDINHIRLETLFSILFWLFLFLAIGIKWEQTLLLYLCFALNWSTRQYITHAFTKRDVVEGAHNLKTNLLLEKLLLNGNWDYEHHLRPDLPWIYLKDQGRENKKVAPVSYLKQYLKLWSGPIRNTEAPPSPLPRLEYIETYKS